jgi:dipeptidyl aminopeptidase/acylaminoacyl peptidase
MGSFRINEPGGQPGPAWEALMTFRRTVATTVLLLAVAAPLGAQQQAAAQLQQQAQRLTLEHFLELETLSNPQISPDGRQIIYTRGWVDPVNDRRSSTVWIMNADGSRARSLMEGGSAQWSPDGSRIAFTRSGEPRGSQIHIRWMDAEGAVSQITRLPESPTGITWAPDGKSLAFTMLVPDRSTWTVRLPAVPGARWTEAPRVIDRPNYRRDGQGYVRPGHRHIFVVSADGGAPRQITSGDHDHGSPEWTPDGRTLVFSGLREDDASFRWRESHVYAIDVATGHVRQLTTRRGINSSPVVSPDGRMIAFTGYDWTDDTYRDADLYVMNIDGSGVRKLSGAFDRSIQNVRWAPNSREIFFTAQSEGSSNLHVATLDGRIRQLSEGVHILNVSSMSTNGTFAATRSAPTEPGQVVTLTARDPSLVQVTHANADLLANVRFGDFEEFWHPSHDGRFRIQGWIIKPPDFDPSKRYPMQLHIHGGPHSMYGVGFNFGWQFHAASDYVVVYTNPRGSTGYGSEFGNAIKRAYPGDDYHDLMASVDHVLGMGFIDQDNMFVTGCSGGGVLTAWIVGHTDRFRAASSNCPVINWLSFVGTTDGIGWYRNFDNYFWDDPSEHLRRSPIMYVGNVKTPTMLMTGIDDLRTPMAQTEEYFQALTVLGVPTAMIRFNEEAHGTSSKPSNFMRTQLYLQSWFERWMTDDALHKRRRSAPVMY